MTRADSKYWHDIGLSDPYWGVLSHEKFKGERLDPDRRAEFFAAGEDDIRFVTGQIRRIRPEFAPRRALDFGCGVGRLAVAMRAFAAEVSGVDVSEPMLEAGRQNVKEMGVSGVEFFQELPHGPFDWINSYIVFQHIEPSEGYRLLQELLERLDEHAVISLHFTIYRDRRVLFRGLQESGFGRFDGANYVSFQRTELMDMPIYEYDLSRIVWMLNQAKFNSLLIAHTDHGGSHGAYIFGAR